MDTLSVLKRINSQFGIEIWNEPSKAIGVYFDLAPKEQAQMKLLKDFCDVGACKIIISAISGTSEEHVEAYYKAVNVMKSRFLYSLEAIEHLCYDFSHAAGIELPGVTIDHETESQSDASPQSSYSAQSTNAVLHTSGALNTANSTSGPKHNNAIKILPALLVSVILLIGIYYYLSRSNPSLPTKAVNTASPQKQVDDVTEMQFQKSDLNSYSKIADFYSSQYALCDNAGTLVFSSVDLNSDGSDYVFLKLLKDFDGSVMFYGKINNEKWSLEGFQASVFDPTNSDAEEICRFFAASLYAFGSVDDYHKADDIISEYLLAWDLESEQYLETITISGKQYELMHTFAEGSMYLSIREI